MIDLTKYNNIFLISIGAIPAAILRWQIHEIFIVNIVGCFLLGLINALFMSRKYKLIFGVGFCGSLTSFSGWSIHLFELISKNLLGQFFFNLILMVLIGFFAVGLGHIFAKKIND